MGIKIKFVDFWPGFDLENWLPYTLIKKNYNVELSEEPEYIFYSVFSNDHLKYGNSIKIFYTAENLVPDFNLCDYAIGFDYLEYGDRYFRFPNFYMNGHKKIYELAEQKHLVDENILGKKQGFCSFVYSNGAAHSIRTDFFEQLSLYKKVDSGGRYMNNINMRGGWQIN